MKKLAVVILMLSSPVMAADDKLMFQESNTNIMVGSFKPNRVLNIMGEDGRHATVDFNGKQVEYSGDLPVDDAAKVFFDAVMRYTRAQDCPKP